MAELAVCLEDCVNLRQRVPLLPCRTGVGSELSGGVSWACRLSNRFQPGLDETSRILSRERSRMGEMHYGSKKSQGQAVGLK